MTETNRLPSADEISSMTPEEAEVTLVAATSVLPLLIARARETRSVHDHEWITVNEAAQYSGMSRFFFHDHWKELPFCRKIGRSVKLNRRGLGSNRRRKRSRIISIDGPTVRIFTSFGTRAVASAGSRGGFHRSRRPNGSGANFLVASTRQA